MLGKEPAAWFFDEWSTGRYVLGISKKPHNTPDAYMASGQNPSKTIDAYMASEKHSAQTEGLERV